MWGWTIEKRMFENFGLLLRKGFRCIDTASNYPINNKTDYFQIF